MRGHSASTRVATAQASSTANTRLTGAIVPGAAPRLRTPLNSPAVRADTRHVTGMTTSSAFLVPWAMVWVVLLRALLVKADVLPKTCKHCGLPFERSRLGDGICRCA
jgi:hypothetical protein